MPFLEKLGLLVLNVCLLISSSKWKCTPLLKRYPKRNAALWPQGYHGITKRATLIANGPASPLLVAGPLINCHTSLYIPLDLIWYRLQNFTTQFLLFVKWKCIHHTQPTCPNIHRIVTPMFAGFVLVQPFWILFRMCSCCSGCAQAQIHCMCFYYLIEDWTTGPTEVWWKDGKAFFPLHVPRTVLSY